MHTTQYKEQLNEAIKSDLELEAILCQIATGGLKIETIVQGEAVLRDVTPTEMITAIDKLYKKRGLYVTKPEADNSNYTFNQVNTIVYVGNEQPPLAACESDVLN
jgi:hypothetical protein